MATERKKQQDRDRMRRKRAEQDATIAALRYELAECSALVHSYQKLLLKYAEEAKE